MIICFIYKVILSNWRNRCNAAIVTFEGPGKKEKGAQTAGVMISHEDPNDLIDSVTAEIEAIIQEEINSQNASSPNEPVAELVAEIIEAEVAPNVEAIKVVKEETNTGNLQQPESIEIVETETINSIENIEAPNKTLQVVEATTETVGPVEATADAVNPVEAAVKVGSVEYVEYTVNVASPTQQEELPTPEAIENVFPAFTVIESILNDAPIDEMDGPRAKHLKQALRKALNNTAKSCG